MEGNYTMNRLFILALLSAVMLTLGCRDVAPRISRRGHILAGRTASGVGGVTTSDLAAGRVVARSDYLAGLEA